MGKQGTARQDKHDNILRRMRFTCWITKATDTHSEYVILILFPRQLVARTRFIVTFMRTLPVLFNVCDTQFLEVFVLIAADAASGLFNNA